MGSNLAVAVNGLSRPREPRSAAALRRRIGARLAARQETLACVEIGSGGLVSQAFTAEAGSSAFYKGALILTADAADWPRALTGDGGWQTEPPGSPARLRGLAALAQAAFGADWGLAVEWERAPRAGTLHLALRGPESTTTNATAPLATATVESSAARLVAYVLERVNARLAEQCEESP